MTRRTRSRVSASGSDVWVDGGRCTGAVVTPTRFPGGSVACTQGTCISAEVATGTRTAAAISRWNSERKPQLVVIASAPLYVLFSADQLTLPVGLTKLQGAYTIDYPVIMAGAALASIPVLLLYIFVQRYVIEGVASSGIKG